MLVLSAAALLAMQSVPPPGPAGPPTPPGFCRAGFEREYAVPAGAQALGRVTWCRADPGLSPVRTVLAGQDDVLAVLADRRYAAFWPEVMAWAGPGLVDFRRKAVALGKAKFDAALARPGRRNRNRMRRLSTPAHGIRRIWLTRRCLPTTAGSLKPMRFWRLPHACRRSTPTRVIRSHGS